MPKAKPKVNISQSFIKNAWEYIYGDACGVQLKEVDIEKNYSRPQSDAMKAGCYFEFLATGQKNRDGSEPLPVTGSKGALSADSKRAVIQAKNFQKMIDIHGMKIIDTGTIIEQDGMKMVLDAVVSTPEYSEAILDLKFSGLLGDKWHPMGWTPETYTYRHSLTIQPLFYKYLYWKVSGTYNVPFMYAIHSSKNEKNYALWEVDIPDIDKAMDDVEKEVKNIRNFLKDTDNLQPRPKMERCAKCPVFDDCMFRLEVPDVQVVKLFGLRTQSDKK